MPFLDGKPWQPNAVQDPSQLSGKEKLYRAPQTGEVFDSYDLYLNHLRLLQSSRWTSLKGTEGLNFSQASLEDSQHKASSLQVSCQYTMGKHSNHHWLCSSLKIELLYKLNYMLMCRPETRPLDARPFHLHDYLVHNMILLDCTNGIYQFCVQDRRLNKRSLTELDVSKA